MWEKTRRTDIDTGETVMGSVARVNSQIKIFEKLREWKKKKRGGIFFCTKLKYHHWCKIPHRLDLIQGYLDFMRPAMTMRKKNDEKRRCTCWDVLCRPFSTSITQQLRMSDGSSSRSGCYYTFETLAVDPFIQPYVILLNRSLFQMWRSILSPPDFTCDY